MMHLATVSVLQVIVAADGRTQQVIAAAAGIERTTFGRILSGQTEPSEDHIRALAKVLGVRPETLVVEMEREVFLKLADTVRTVEKRAKK